MTPDQFEQRWSQLTGEVIAGMTEWRQQHLRATLKEIEQAVDQRLGRLRARRVEDTAQSSRKANLAALPLTERPGCSQDGVPASV